MKNKYIPVRKMEYKHKTYGQGWSIKATPEDRGMDVMHYLITGYLLGGRSLDGVTWEEVDDYEMIALQRKRFNQLTRDMNNTMAAKANKQTP